MKKEQKVTIGAVDSGLAGQFTSLQDNVREVESWLDGMSTEEYISTLIDRLNAEINATGGYFYIIEGLGVRTYDVAVSDPAVGTEANAVVEMRGGTIRIANTKDGQGNWEWKTVFTSGHIAGELVTAAQIITGYIGSAGGTYIDLDHDTINLGTSNGLLTFLNGLGTISKNTHGALEVISSAGVHVGQASGGEAGSNGTTVIDGGETGKQVSLVLGNPDQLAESYNARLDSNTFTIREPVRYANNTLPYDRLVYKDGQLFLRGRLEGYYSVDLHTTDYTVNSSGADAITQDYVGRFQVASDGSSFGYYLRPPNSNNITHFLLQSDGRINYRNSTDGGSTYTSQRGIRVPWTSLGSVTGFNTVNISSALSNYTYEEIMVVVLASSNIFSNSVQRSFLTSSNRTFYLGGGYSDNSQSSFANVRVTTSGVTLLNVYVNGSSVGGTATMTVYAR